MHPGYRAIYCISILLFNLLFLQTAVLAADNDDYQNYQEKLDKVQKSINKVKEHLKSTRYKRGHVVTELQQLESEISKNSAELSQTEARVESLDSKIAELRAELDKLQKQLDIQRRGLAEQLRAAYAIGRQQQVKMLLNQQDPAEMGRVIVYFDYLNRARERNINAFLISIDEKRRVEDDLNSTLDEYKLALNTRKKQKNSLLSQRLKRNELLARLEQQIKNQEQNLTELESSRNRIENLLMSLGELLAGSALCPPTKPYKF